MKGKELRKRAGAFLLSIGVAASQLLTWQPGTMTVRAATTQNVQDAEESQQDADASGGQDEDAQESGINQALLLYLEASDLDGAPQQDANALKATLSKTDQFDGSNITIQSVPEDSDNDAKTGIWEQISAMAEKTDENSFTVIAYSGHGGSNMDGSSYLAAGGVNDITAAELRNHLDELQGRVLVILSCCYSGGMITTASEFEDGEETGSSFSDTSFIDEFSAQEYSGGRKDTEENSSIDDTLKKEDKEKTEKAAAEKSAADKKKAEETSAEAASSGKSSETASTETGTSGKTFGGSTASEDSSSENTSAESAPSKETEEKSESSETSGTETTSVNESAAEEKSAEQSDAENTSANASSEEKQLTKSVEDDSSVVKKASVGKVKTASNPPRYYFLTAANQRETGWSQSGIGTEMIAAFGHALGYDRNSDNYRVYAADTEANGTSVRQGYQGDGEITMAELENYYKNLCKLTSTPTIYPSGCEDVLFTYSEDAGVPASFTAINLDGNVTVDEEGKISVNVTVNNLTDHEITVTACAYDEAYRPFAYTSVSSGKSVPEGYDLEEGYYEALEGYESGNVSGGPTTINFQFQSEDFLYGTADGQKNPFCLKIWDSTDGQNQGSYEVLSFYVVKQDAEKDSINADAFSLSKPAQVTNDGEHADQYTVTNTCSRLPIEIVYDDELADKYTYAACKLSLYSYDLGEDIPKGIYVEKDGKNSDILKDEDDQAIVLEENIKKTKQAVFEEVRPNHDRITDGQWGDIRGSVYTYVMDTSGLTLHHYYALEFVCRDDTTGQERKIYAIIQRTTAEQTQTNQIHRFELSVDAFDVFRAKDGIPADDSYKDNFKEEDLRVKKVQENLQTALHDSAAGQYDFEVSDWKKLTDSENDTWASMDDTDTFTPGETYSCKVKITVAKNNDSVFTDDTLFSANRHTIKKGSIEISDDYKTVTLELIHHLAAEESLKETTLKMYRIDNDAVGKEVKTDAQSLHPGDKVILVPGENCRLTYAYGMKKTNSTIRKNGVKYDIYEVEAIEEGETSSNLIGTVWKNENDSCGCAQVLYLWKAYAEAEGGDDSGSDSSSGSSSGSSASGESSSGSSSGSSSSGESSSGSSSASSSSASSSSGSSTSGNSGSSNDSSSGNTENSSSGSGSGSNGSSASSSSGNSAAGKNKNAAAAASAASASTAVTALPAADAQTAAAAGTGNGTANGSAAKASQTQGAGSGQNNGTDSGQKSSTGSSQKNGAGTSAGSSVNDADTEESAGESTTEETSGKEKSKIQSAEEQATTGDNSLTANADGENSTSQNSEKSGQMLWMYLILLWILAVVLGIIIFILYKRRKNKEDEQYR